MQVIVTAPVTHLCPFVEETDVGRVRIVLRDIHELHDLAKYLRSFADRKVTHEQMTQEIAAHLGAEVRTYWTTAGLAVEVVAGEPSST